MANNILVVGESGSGKTTSVMTLPAKETFFIDADGKGLSYKGWRDDYNKENKNYIRTSDKDTIMKVLSRIDKNEFPDVKYIVIDTINGIMVDDEFNRMKEKTYDKWMDLAAAVYGIIKYAMLMRDELTVIFMAHAQTERDDSGNEWTHVKTSGKKLDKIVLESKFNTVLLAKCVDGHHIFETHSNNSTAKTPYGAFEEDYVPNDMMAVIKQIEAYR